MMSAMSGRLTRPRTAIDVSGSASPTTATRRSWRWNQTSTTMKAASTRPAAIAVWAPEMGRGPEEIDAVQEADEQRRVAQRRQRAADIGDQDDEEHHHMHVVETAGVGAQQRPHQDHRRAGGADDAGDRGAEHQDRGVDERRAAQASGDENSARDHVEREQQDDEAHVFAEQRMDERGKRRRQVVERRHRHDGQRAPGEGDLAVMGVPELRKQQRAGRDRKQEPDEGKRPRPTAAKRRRGRPHGRGVDRPTSAATTAVPAKAGDGAGIGKDRIAPPAKNATPSPPGLRRRAPHRRIVLRPIPPPATGNRPSNCGAEQHDTRQGTGESSRRRWCPSHLVCCARLGHQHQPAARPVR